MKFLFQIKTIVFLAVLLNPNFIQAATTIVETVEEVDPATAVISNWFTPTPDTMPTGTQHLAFKSPTAQADVGYSVYLPPGYPDPAISGYSVIYWLHGTGSNEVGDAEWLAPIVEKAIQAGKIEPVIIVFPNAGGTTMWVDTYDQTLLTETIVIKELLPLIDTKFSTQKNRTSRFLEGFSMGGFGAAKYLFKYPQRFSSAATYGAAYSTVGNISTKDEFIPVFGGSIDFFLQNNPATFAEKYISGDLATRYPVKIRSVVGTLDPLLGDNRSIKDHLITLGITPKYQELVDFKHNAEKYFRAAGIPGIKSHF